MAAFFLYGITALAELAGCYAAWNFFKEGRPWWWLAASLSCLLGFAWLLTLHPGNSSGRIYAAYGGVYVACSVFWIAAVDRQSPDRWDCLGLAVCLVGAAIIYFGPRTGL